MDDETNETMYILGEFDSTSMGPLANSGDSTLFHYFKYVTVSIFRNGPYLCKSNRRMMSLYRYHKRDSNKYWRTMTTTTVNDDEGTHKLMKKIKKEVGKTAISIYDSNANLTDGITLPSGVIIYEGAVTRNNEASNVDDRRLIFIPVNVVTQIIEWNKKPQTGISEIFKAQKQFLHSWERENRRFSGYAGEALALLFKRTNKRIHAIAPDDLDSNWTLLPSTNAACRQQLNNIVFTPSSEEMRAEYAHYNQQLLEAFCKRHRIPHGMRLPSQPRTHGIDLKRSLPLFDFASNEVVDIRDIFVFNGQIRIRTGLMTRTYRIQLPEQLSADELTCLEVACNATTSRGLFASVELLDDVMRITTDGLLETIPGAQSIKKTLIDGYCLLSSLISGFDVLTNSITKSSITTYENPFDVQFRLLRTRNSVEDGEAAKAQQDSRSFADIGHHMKLVVDPESKLRIKDGKIIYSGNAMKIDLMGIYSDPYGNKYYDDNASKCYSANTVVHDLTHRFLDYCKLYRVLRRLQSYAIVIGLLLNKPKESIIVSEESFKISAVPRQFPNESKELKAIKREVCKVKESAVMEERSRSDQTIMLLNLANLWTNYDLAHARDLVRIVLLELSVGTLANCQEHVRQKLVRDSCVMLICSLATNDDCNKLSPNEIETFKALLAIDQWPDPRFCSNDDAIYLRAIEIALGHSLQLGSWETTKFLIKNLQGLVSGLGSLLSDRDQGDQNKYEFEILAWLALRNKAASSVPTHVAKEFIKLSDKYVIAGGGKSTTDDVRRYLFLLNFVTCNDARNRENQSRDQQHGELAFTALVYLLLHKKWVCDAPANPASSHDEDTAAEFYEQIGFLMRSLNACLQLASTNCDVHRHWIQLSHFIIKYLLQLFELLHRNQLANDVQQRFTELMQKTEALEATPRGNMREQRQRARSVLRIAHKTRELAEEAAIIDIMQEATVAIAFAYRKLEDQQRVTAWQRASVTDGLRLREVIP